MKIEASDVLAAIAISLALCTAVLWLVILA